MESKNKIYQCKILKVMILILLLEVPLPRKTVPLKKLIENCPLIESEMSKVHTRKMEIVLGLEMSLPNNIVRCHSNNIIDSTLLQECISEAAICSRCKSSKSRLELWQDDTKRCGLDEWLFTKCSECSHIVRLQSIKKCENRFSEINIRSVNAGIVLVMVSVTCKKL